MEYFFVIASIKDSIVIIIFDGFIKGWKKHISDTEHGVSFSIVSMKCDQVKVNFLSYLWE